MSKEIIDDYVSSLDLLILIEDLEKEKESILKAMRIKPKLKRSYSNYQIKFQTLSYCIDRIKKTLNV